ncbi:Zinc finger RING/FYVE/PHD-type protein [Macrophomina phaseolina MS6]|uniref:Zinc finger RING/FYVE/PHD-type protein n=1 Tax=Macrophomina phaseolina (strain MS6) TaxID=1126212 RepID=K2SGZ5_MACPH|nr:Zinc finger RING/FYVE/PHD-type protein [Macrophomina phaseolina MS6]
MADIDMTDAPAAPAKTKTTKASGEAASDGKKKFEVKKWNAVALWAWDIVVDNCAICRNHIMDLCKARSAGSSRNVGSLSTQALNVRPTRRRQHLKNAR